MAEVIQLLVDTKIQLTSDEIVAAIVKGDGKLNFACDILMQKHKHELALNEKIETSDLMDVINQDPATTDLIFRQLRMKFALNVYGNLCAFTDELSENIENIEPKELIRAVSTLGTLFTSLTNTKSDGGIGETFTELAQKVVDGLNHSIES